MAQLNIAIQKVVAQFLSEAGEVGMGAADNAADVFFETINPELTVSGRIQPSIFGFPVGEPVQESQIAVSLLDNGGLLLDGRLSLPLLITDPIRLFTM